MKPRNAETDNQPLTIDCVGYDDERTRAIPSLNGFFANSMNSPAMSMVNFCCCVRFAPNATREVAAQPMRSAVRMEARVHAGV